LDGNDAIDQTVCRAEPVGPGEDQKPDSAIWRLRVSQPAQAFGVVAEWHKVFAGVCHIVERIARSGVLEIE